MEMGCRTKAKHSTEADMSKGSIHVSVSIEFKSINTGGQSVGNGGDGNFSGAIINKPTLSFDPYNKADGASVHSNAGDHVSQTADWQAGGANATASWFAKAHGGSATSDGSQSSDSGPAASKVCIPATATHTASVMADT